LIEKMKIVKAATQNKRSRRLGRGKRVFPMVIWKKSKFGERADCWGHL